MKNYKLSSVMWINLIHHPSVLEPFSQDGRDVTFFVLYFCFLGFKSLVEICTWDIWVFSLILLSKINLMYNIFRPHHMHSVDMACYYRCRCPRSLCLSVCVLGWTDEISFMGQRDDCVRCGCTIASPGKYDRMIHLLQWCGLVRLLGPLVEIGLCKAFNVARFV